MFNLFDILQSQGGGGMQSLGQQFGLSPDQSRRAMEALLPALMIGLQHNAATDPAGFGRLFGFAGADPRAGGRHPLQPDLLLGQIFGSPAISQAVLQQAAAASGIGTQALRQMLPVMAGMIVAGIVHVMLNQQPPAAPARREPEPPPAGFPAVGFWNDWMDSFVSSANMNAPPPPQRPAPTREPVPANREAPPSPTPATPAKPDTSGEVPLEVFQQMFQTGVQVQEHNVKAMQDIFDSFWSRSSDEAQVAAEAEAQASPANSPVEAADDPSRETGKPRKSRAKPGKAN